MRLALALGLLVASPLSAQEKTVLRVAAGEPLEEAARALGEILGRETPGDVVVELGGGRHFLERTLVLGPDACGDDGRAVIWRAAPGESVTLSGGRLVTDWRVEDDGSWSAPAPPHPVRQLFVDGERRTRARWPQEGWLRVAAPGPDGRTSFTFAEGDLAAWPDLGGAELVFLHDWSMSRLRVASIDAGERRVQMAEPVGGYLPFFHITGFEPHPRYALENLHAAWNAPGEWYLDAAAQRLRYWPLPGEAPERTKAVLPWTGRLLEVRGEPGTVVRRLRFEGIAFAHTRAMQPAGGYAGIQAAFHDARGEGSTPGMLPPASAVRVRYADGVVFEDCRFEHLGASALWLGEGVRNARVSRCRFSDVGANGLLIGEPAEPEQASGLAAHVVCEDSTFERCGVLCHGAVGIWIGIAQHVGVRHNEVRELPYTGISLGWIWDPRPSPSRGHVIERNHIHHVMQTLSDGGGIYTLGRQPDTYLRHNLIHDVPVNLGRAGSNGFFIDEGSADLTIEGNVVYAIARAPLRFHKAGRNVLLDNRLVTAPGIPPFEFNACSPDPMVFLRNRIVAPADWTPPSAAALHAGPR